MRLRRHNRDHQVTGTHEPATPKIIHRFWAGSVKPDYVDLFGSELAIMHPDWQVKDWTKEGLPATVLNQVALTTARVARKDVHRHTSNLVRYALLAEYGGVWVDCDVRPLRPFDVLLADHPRFASLYGNPEGALILSPPGHPVFERLLADAGKAAGKKQRPGSLDLSGAGLLKRTIRSFDDVELLPASAVFGTDAAGRPLDEPGLTGGPVADHMWAGSRLAAYRSKNLVRDLGVVGGGRVAIRDLVAADLAWVETLTSPVRSSEWFGSTWRGRPVVVNLDEQPVGVVGCLDGAVGASFLSTRSPLMKVAAPVVGAYLVRRR